MIRYFGQPKFSGNLTRYEPVGYEVFLREEKHGKWCVPTDFSVYTADEIKTRLERVLTYIATLNIEYVSVNLDRNQFVDPDYINVMISLRQEISLPRLVVELTEYDDKNVTAQQLLNAAKCFTEHNVLVCLDDVGSGANTMALAQVMEPYIFEYKFALQNFKDTTEALTELAKWHSRANEFDKYLTVEGIENLDMATYLEQFDIAILQGYFFAKPSMLAVG